MQWTGLDPKPVQALPLRSSPFCGGGRMHKFSKVLLIVILCSQYVGALTFELLCGGRMQLNTSVSLAGLGITFLGTVAISQSSGLVTGGQCVFLCVFVWWVCSLCVCVCVCVCPCLRACVRVCVLSLPSSSSLAPSPPVSHNSKPQPAHQPAHHPHRRASFHGEYIHQSNSS